MVQTFATKRVARYLSSELDANITLDKIYFKPFTSLEIINFKWDDNNGKTILAVESLESSFVLSQLIQNKLQIDEININKGYIDIEIFKDSTNFSQAISYFSSSKKDKNVKKNKLELKLDRIVLHDNTFKLINHNYNHHNKGVDFSDLEVTNFSVTFDDIKLDSILQADISDFTLKEKSGLIIRKINTLASYSKHKMEFKDLYVETNRSVLTDYVKFEYDSIKDFQDFIKKVQVTGDLKSSKISSRDIEYFASDLKTVVFDTNIKRAKLNGTVEKIQARNVHLTTAKQTELEGDFTIKGLPYINKTIFDFNLKSLTTSSTDVEILVPALSNQTKFDLPEQLDYLGKISFTGKFKGLYNDFIVNGLFNTALGNLTTESHIDIKKPLKYAGHIKSSLFQIGKFINNNSLKNTGFDINFQGTNLNIEDLTLAFNGQLENTTFQDYQYNKLQLTGEIANKKLNIEGSIDDKNLQVGFNTTLDWQDNKPNYLLDATISHAALQPLKWTTRDSVVIHEAIINTNLTGSSLNTFIGHLYADSIKMSTSKGDFEINSIDFIAEGTEANRTLTLASDVADAKVKGNIDLNTIVPYFKSLAMRYAPAIAIDLLPYNAQNFNLEVSIKSFKPIASLIDPNLILDDGAYLNADFSSNNYTARFTAFSPSVIYKGMKLSNLSIQETADERAFSLDLVADRLSFADSTYINNIAIVNVLANDSLRFKIAASNQETPNYLNLDGNIHFAYNEPAYIKIQDSEIKINHENWKLNPDALLRISKGKVHINNLLLSQGQQRVTLNGIVSNQQDKLNILFDNFSLTSLNGFTKPLGIELQGKLNGNLALNSLLKNPYASANIETSPILYNLTPIGQLKLNAQFEPSIGIANLNINLFDDLKKGVSLKGEYDFSNANNPLNLKGELKELDLIVFQPFLRTIVSDLRGRSSADLTIEGSLRNPKISGLGRFHNVEFNVNYLKAPFKVNNQIALIENNSIILQNFIFNDAKGRQTRAEGIVNLAKVANPYIDIDLHANNVLLLNTTFKDNNLYYGTAYATGVFEFKGFTNALNIDINAKSEAGTIINIPFNNAMTVTDSDFIYFVSQDSSNNKQKDRKSFFNGLTMNMDFNLTRDAEVNLQTNLGSLKGNGNGAITMKISNLGDFEMFGDYVVNNGKFHFTAQDFFNKFFDIKEGGTIRWTGNPSDAIVNLNALYQQRTSTRPLYNAAGRDGGEDERVLAQADMLIKGTLEQPDITFDLNFPQNPYIKDQLQSYLSDINNVNQQALSLIVRRSFTPSTTEQIGREVNNTLLSAGAEIAFNQLNNIISQSLNINFFDLNIRSLNDASASLRLWDDRLILTGGITDRTNFQATDLTFFREGVTTDAELTYRLRKDGNLMARAYNRPYTRNFLLRSSDSEYISALGLVYRQEFNSINEFWKKLWTWGGIKKEDKPKEKK